MTNSFSTQEDQILLKRHTLDKKYSITQLMDEAKLVDLGTNKRQYTVYIYSFY